MLAIKGKAKATHRIHVRARAVMCDSVKSMFHGTTESTASSGQAQVKYRVLHWVPRSREPRPASDLVLLTLRTTDIPGSKAGKLQNELAS